MPRRRSTLLLVAGLVLVALNLRAIVTIVGPLVPELRADRDLSRTAVGLLAAVPLLAFGLVSPLAPRLAARFGSDRTLVAALLVLAVALALRPVPPLALLFAGTLAAGCAVAIANVLMPALLKRHFPDRAAFMAATYSVVLGIGAALAAGLAVPSAEQLGSSWELALGIWALPALLAALVWLPQAREAPRHGERLAAAVARPGLWRDRVAWQVTAFLALVALLFYAMAAWLPDVYRAEGMSAAEAGGLLSIALIAGLPLGIVVGVAAERLGDQRPIALAAVAPLAAGWLGVLLAPLAAPWLWAALLGCGFGTAFPLVLALTVLRAPDARHAAELSGMSQAAGYTAAAIGPVAIGALHDLSGGWRVPLATLTALTLPALAAGLGGSRPRHVGASHSGDARPPS